MKNFNPKDYLGITIILTATATVGTLFTRYPYLVFPAVIFISGAATHLYHKALSSGDRGWNAASNLEGINDDNALRKIFMSWLLISSSIKIIPGLLIFLIDAYDFNTKSLLFGVYVLFIGFRIIYFLAVFHFRKSHAQHLK
jgi:hypothetical protein